LQPIPRSVARTCGPAGLLLVVFNDLRRAHLCLIWATPKLSQGPALTQQVPTLVQFHLYLHQAVTVIIRECRLGITTVRL